MSPTTVCTTVAAIPTPASWAVPRWPMIAESASRNSGSAINAPNAGTASARIWRFRLFPPPARDGVTGSDGVAGFPGVTGPSEAAGTPRCSPWGSGSEGRESRGAREFGRER